MSMKDKELETRLIGCETSIRCLVALVKDLKAPTIRSDCKCPLCHKQIKCQVCGNGMFSTSELSTFTCGHE